MYKSKWEHKDLVIKILKEALKEDPHTNCYIGKKTIFDNKQTDFFFEYNFIYAMEKGVVYVSDNNDGCALWVKYGKSNLSLKMSFAKLRFIFTFGFKHTRKVMQMQDYIKKQYKHNSFLHLLYLGVLPSMQRKGIASSLLNPVLNKAKLTGTPVYLETSTKINVSIYRKKGFRMYHKWKVPECNDLNIYFMQFQTNPQH